jgi:carbon storage regulator CsrA
MIIVDCKRTEQFKIGENINIRVLTIGGYRVRLGIEAPVQTPIFRAELERLDHRPDAVGKSRAHPVATDSPVNQHKRCVDRQETRQLDDRSDSDTRPSCVQDMAMDLP